MFAGKSMPEFEYIRPPPIELKSRNSISLEWNGQRRDTMRVNKITKKINCCK